MSIDHIWEHIGWLAGCEVMPWTTKQLSPKPQLSECRLSIKCVVVKRPDHHCGYDLVYYFSCAAYSSFWSFSVRDIDDTQSPAAPGVDPQSFKLGVGSNPFLSVSFSSFCASDCFFNMLVWRRKSLVVKSITFDVVCYLHNYPNYERTFCLRMTGAFLTAHNKLVQQTSWQAICMCSNVIIVLIFKLTGKSCMLTAHCCISLPSGWDTMAQLEVYAVFRVMVILLFGFLSAN